MNWIEYLYFKLTNNKVQQTNKKKAKKPQQQQERLVAMLDQIVKTHMSN